MSKLVSINQLIEEHKNIVTSIIYGLPYVPKSVEYEDLKQIGLISLWGSMKTYRPERKMSLKNYLYMSVRRDIYDHLKGLARDKRKAIEPQRLKTQSSNFESETIGKMIVSEMQKYVSDINIAIFVDKHVHKYTYSELCDKYNMSEGQISNRLHQTKLKLKKRLIW